MCAHVRNFCSGNLMDLMDHRIQCNTGEPLWKGIGVFFILWILPCVDWKALSQTACVLSETKAGVDVMMFILFQTLTGKEIEIDIEPTDKVNHNCPCKTEKCHTHLYTVDSQGSQLFLCKCRWSELKKGWRRKRGSPRSSKDWSTVENRCEFLHHGPSCSAEAAGCSYFSTSLL